MNVESGDVLQSVAVDVGRVDAHAGLGDALAVQPRAAPGADLGELALAVVAVEEVGVRVVGDEDIDIAIVVQVRGEHAQTVRFGHCRSCRPASVASSKVPSALLRKKRSRPPRRPKGPAMTLTFSRQRLVRRAASTSSMVRFDVAGDVKIEVAVAVGVEEAGPGRPAAVRRLPPFRRPARRFHRRDCGRAGWGRSSVT